LAGYSQLELPGIPSVRQGVLPSQQIEKLIREGEVYAAEKKIEKKQIQPASLDLRLGSQAYRLQASFLPGSRSRFESKLSDLAMAEFDLSQLTILEKGCVYLVKLMEGLRLPKDLEARANPKSTTGRLDVFTRLITECGTEFERVEREYSGPLYAEIMPRSFSVIVHPGLSLSQIRFIRGSAELSVDELQELDREETLIYIDEKTSGARIRDGGVSLSVNLRGSGDEVVAYRGKKNPPLVDLEKVYDPDRFWDPIKNCPDGRLILNPGDFYILASRERVRVPRQCAAEMVPFDPSVGEFRIHYAGFFDPGFGYGNGNITGTRAVLEVRAHETPFVIEHEQIVGRLVYSWVRGTPDKIYGKSIGSSYQRQELALSKQFRRSVP
jgi:dCTP deaminase